MNKIIGKVYAQYEKSCIVQFLLSYILVLLIPLFIAFIGFQMSFHVVRNDIQSANLKMLNHTKSVLDNELNSCRLYALQVAYNEKLQVLASYGKADAEFFLDAKDTIDYIFALPGFNENNFVKSIYVSLFKPEYVLANKSLYNLDTFEPYLKERGLTIDEWCKMCKGNGKRNPFFYVSQENIEFVLPFSSVLAKENLGAVVCNISNDEMESLLDFSNEYEEYSLFIYDKNNQLLWSNDLLKIGSFIKADSKTDIKSNLYGWKYILVVPQYSALKRLYNLKIVVLFLIILAAVTGIFISVFLSIKNGKPINGLFAALENHNKNTYGISHNVRNLVLLFEDLEAKIGKNELFYPDLLEDNLILSIKSGNEEDTENIITLIKDENCKNRNLDDEMFALLHGNMIATLKNVIGENIICDELCFVPEKNDREKFFDLYTKKCIELCSSLWEKKNKTRKELVDKMMEFVNANFSDSSLGLGKLSQVFNVSESYVSLVFKEQSGQNFQSYLETIRINNACSLLRNTKQSVEDISSSCGYYTVQSFRRAFKKVTGFSPTEYRKKA